MIILGKNSDDKGTQLEKLTDALLKKRGYTNLAPNVVGSGGEELDVTGERRVPQFGSGEQVFRLICECKATKVPCDLTQWLKFLGKIFSAEAKGKETVQGCFIALSGLNGNCIGHYNDLKAHRPSIALLKGDELLQETRAIYPFASLETVSAKLSSLTDRQTRLREVAYYNERVYWLVAFEHDRYTILDADGDMIDEGRVAPIREMVDEGNYSFGTYIDLQEDIRAKDRALSVVKFVLGQLIFNNGRIQSGTLTPNDYGFSEPEVRQAINTIKSRQVVVESGVTISIPEESPDGSYTHFCSMYQMLLEGESESRWLDQSYYVDHINEKLLDEILKRQGGLPLPGDMRARALQLLRLSPTALLYLLQPVAIIVNSRKQGPLMSEVQQKMDQMQVDVFFQILIESLRHDFDSRGLAAYFFHVRKIVELDFTIGVKIKSKEKVVLEEQVRFRTGLGEYYQQNPDGTHPLIILRVGNFAPEPWETPQAPSAAPPSPSEGTR